jgi:hypothetical protein
MGCECTPPKPSLKCGPSLIQEIAALTLMLPAALVTIPFYGMFAMLGAASVFVPGGGRLVERYGKWVNKWTCGVPM